jgi:hypothetical protein
MERFMNERIRELAEQAWIMVSDEERARNQLYEADTQRERRDQVFAELIVRECVEIVDARWDPVLVEKIKEHFGVEE